MSSVEEKGSPYKRASDVPGDMHLAREVATERWRPGKASDRFRRTTWCGLTQVSYSAAPSGGARGRGGGFKATYNKAMVTCGECLERVDDEGGEQGGEAGER